MTDRDSQMQAPLVLVVDDDATTRLLLRQTIERHGLRVAEAADGASGLAEFQRLHPDIVLLDVMMPDMDGFEVCAQLRRLAGGANTPVLMITGLDDSVSIDRAYQSGATDFITKPITWPILGHRLRYILRSARLTGDLARSETRFRATFDQTAVGITHVAMDGRFLMVNWKFCEILGYSKDEMLQLSVDEITYPQDRARSIALRMQIDSGKTDTFVNEKRLVRKDGTVIWATVTVSLIRDQDGRPMYKIGVIQDISERRRTEEALQRTNDDLKAINARLQEVQNQLLQSEKMASIGQLAAGVAHEINNPIGYVYSNLGTLQKYLQQMFGVLAAYESAEGALAPEALEALRALKREADLEFLREDVGSLMAESREGITRVKKIVQDLKDFSHVGAQEEWQWADLHKGLDSTLNIVNNEIKYKAQVVKRYGELPEVRCLPSQLNQVFMNLLVNAAHAIEQQGEIRLSSGVSGEEVWVEVADTGKGIAPEHLGRIFDPFFTTKAVGQGTGLGLSLSYGIVRKHHGRIEVESEPGKGATFRIILPIQQPAVFEAGSNQGSGAARRSSSTR